MKVDTNRRTELKKYKSRVVFRGDCVKDETGGHALFNDMGSSASRMAGAKFIDAIARMPGMSGENSDAVAAYTQVPLKDVCKMLGNNPDDFPVTYITLPRNRRPREWDSKYSDPVVVLDLNLYGHPLAGLVWELHCDKIVRGLGFKKVPSWECLYYHEENSSS